MLKLCKCCNIEKDIELFVKHRRIKSGYSCICKNCYSDKYREINKQYKKKNPDIAKESRKKYEKKNVESLKLRRKNYYDRNKEIIIKKGTERILKKRKENPLWRISHSVRNNLRGSLRRNNYDKKGKTETILGCSFNEFKLYLESKFEDWMDWDNYGKYNGEFNFGWDIDHIIPISNGKTEEDILNLNHYSNLQPLCSKMNRDIKKNNLI